jgi:arsenate reductase
MSEMKRILFLCTGNAARSQMAEGLMRAFHGDAVDVVSAGSRPAGWVHPLAISALAEIGIDIRDAQSKSADEFLDQQFDIVVTVCDSAAQDCPLWPGAKRIEHWPIEDPTWGEGSGAARFAATRDELASRIEELMKNV